MNRLILTLRYQQWKWQGTHHICFYSNDTDRWGRRATVCILNIETDEIVTDYRKS